MTALLRQDHALRRITIPSASRQFGRLRRSREPSARRDCVAAGVSVSQRPLAGARSAVELVERHVQRQTDTDQVHQLQMRQIREGPPAAQAQAIEAGIEAVLDETALARIVSDYIAGMTDRFALQDHKRLTGQ